MADQNLVNEKKSLLEEAKAIETNANAEIKAIQEKLSMRVLTHLLNYLETLMVLVFPKLGYQI